MSSTSPAIRGHAGASTWYPRLSKRCFQPSQLRGVSHRPWIRTMGGAEAGVAMALLCGGQIASLSHANRQAECDLGALRCTGRDACRPAVYSYDRVDDRESEARSAAAVR